MLVAIIILSVCVISLCVALSLLIKALSETNIKLDHEKARGLILEEGLKKAHYRRREMAENYLATLKENKEKLADAYSCLEMLLECPNSLDPRLTQDKARSLFRPHSFSFATFKENNVHEDHPAQELP